jgi:pimeloyl-ACP methyl ester carboxylesterase
VASPRVRTGSLYDQGEARVVAGLETWIVRAGPQGGTPVVFLHGTPTSAYAWRDVMRAMHEERECIAFDWPGFGQSAKPRDGDYTHRARADHLKATLDALRVERAHLVAHDVGGPAALLFAAENPGRVERLALLNTTVFRRDYRPPLPLLTQLLPVLRELAKPFLNRAAFDLFFKQGLARPDRVPRAVLDHHWKLATRDGGKATVLETWAQFPEGMATLEVLRSKLPSLEIPALVLFGAEDPWLPPPNAERMAKALPQATLQLLPGAGHFVMEDAPEVVAERLLSFFA